MADKEFVGIVSLECYGTKHQLDTPIAVSIDLASDGTRRVGCPFIFGVQDIPSNETLFFCPANPELNASKKARRELDEFRDLLGLNPDEALEDEHTRRWESFKRDARGVVPYCHHKEAI